MDRQESKYFRTATIIDEAFLEILETKDITFITVTELCKKAGVNRSTFYLHYENLSDVLSECVENMMTRLRAYYPDITWESLKAEGQDRLVTDELILPYLRFLKDHQRLFQSVIRNSSKLSLPEYYTKLFKDIFSPAMDNFQIQDWKRKYVSAFHIEGMVAIVKEWIEGGCEESPEEMSSLIISCVTDPASLMEGHQTS